MSARQIADDLRIAITNGTYRPGDQLPAEPDLMDTYAVSRMTVRSALSTLQAEGLVTSRHGRGTFVREDRALRRMSSSRYRRSVWMEQPATLGAEAASQGRDARRSVVLATVPAPAAVADRLGLAPDTPVWSRQRVVRLDGRPVQLADSYYPLDVVATTRLRESEPGRSDFAELHSAGHSPDTIREEWKARMPTPTEIEALDLLPGVPVLDLIRTTTDEAGRAVEVMLSVIAADSTALVYDVPVSD